MQCAKFALGRYRATFSVAVTHEHSTVIAGKNGPVVCRILTHQVEGGVPEKVSSALLDNSVSQVSYCTRDSVDNLRLFLHDPISVGVINRTIVLWDDVSKVVIIFPLRIP